MWMDIFIGIMLRETLQYFYNNARLPGDDSLLKLVNAAAIRLARRLETLKKADLHISDYSKRYLLSSLEDLGNTLQRYTFILSWALAELDTPLDKTVFIDYGGGIGILALLAKEVDIGTVVYNDIYDVSCEDARVIALAAENMADYYVQGDIEDLLRFLQRHSMNCHAIASYDVIEHIYDIDHFLKSLAGISEKSLTMVMASGANPYNPLIKKKIVRQQIQAEFEDRDRQWGHKERDSLMAYLRARKAIISMQHPHFQKRPLRNWQKRPGAGSRPISWRPSKDTLIGVKSLLCRAIRPTRVILTPGIGRNISWMSVI